MMSDAQSYSILRYPNPILRKESKDILQSSVLEDATVLLSLEKTLDAATNLLMTVDHGAALAAPQIGVLSRWFVTNQDLTSKQKYSDVVRSIPPVIINPRILFHSNDCLVSEESCLSFPGLVMHVSRWKEICVEYSTILHYGSKQKKEWHNIKETYTDFWARLFQHEIDHLDGKLFVDSLPKFKRLQIAKKIEGRY